MTYSLEDMDEYKKMFTFVCNQHYPNCLTSKCPMRKFYCYSHTGIQDMLKNKNLRNKEIIVKELKKVSKEYGYGS